MNFGELFWLALLAAVFYPLIKQKALELSRKRLLAHLLAEGTWTHDYPITFEMAHDLGLPVTTAMPKEVLALMKLFPQPMRQVPAVEYLPTPRRRKPS